VTKTARYFWGIVSFNGYVIWGIASKSLSLALKTNSYMIFKRKLYNDMLQWKHESDGQTALLIKGARRVGKSTLARTFAEKEYKSYIAIDFTSCRQEVRDLFEDISNLDYLFMRL
jgi:hypothetical protein